MFNENYQLRSFKPGDEQGVLNLWETAFKSQMPLKRFQWKYLETPYDEAMMLCVTKTGEIVTFYGGIPYRFQYKDRLDRAVQLMDIMSHPGHKKNRVFITTAKGFMSQFCDAGKLLFMYGFPGAVHYAIGEPRLNYRKIAPAAYLKASPKQLHGRDPVGAAGNTIRMEPVSSLAANDPDWEELWENCCRDYPLSLIREPAFVKWRYFDHPEKQYGVMRFIRKDSGTMVGYAVLLMTPEKTILVDMLTGKVPAEAGEMFSCLGSFLDGQGVEHLETWLPENHFMARFALAAGFEREAEPLGIIPTVSLFSHSPPLEWVVENLYYTMGDADLF